MAINDEHKISQWKAIIPNTVTETEKQKSCFDCNICLEFVHEPIVTLCGHLYCWSCIYKWLHIQSASLAPNEPPQCPVCKDHISHTTMIPLYGRAEAEAPAPTPQGISIPPRPPASGIQSLLVKSTQSSQSLQQLQYRNPYQSQQYFNNSPSYQQEENRSETSQMLMTQGGFPDRQEMMVDKSLNRISFFLFCFFLLCLILF